MLRRGAAPFLLLVTAAVAMAAAPPRIRSFSPASGPPETVVRIEGNDLTAVRRVFIGGAEAGFRTLSASSLQAAVPTEAVTGPIVVMAAQGADTSHAVFQVEPRTPSAGAFVLEPARPGPQPGGLTWRFLLPRNGPARFEVCDLKGVRLRALVEGTLEAGVHERSWDGRDARGRRVPGGLCYAVLEFEGRRIARLSVLMPEED
jgi:hypothetical protein